MSLVYPLVAISALVWLVVAVATLWLAWKLWMTNGTAEDRQEDARGDVVAQPPKRDKLTDYRCISAEMVVDETGEASLIGGWDV